MTLYNVHIYREMRLFFPGIVAATPEEAARIAAGKLTEEADYSDDCEGENLAALVDVVGDDQHEQSVMIDFEPERLRKAAGEMLAALLEVEAFVESSLNSSDSSHWEAGLCDILKIARAAIGRATSERKETA